MEADSSGQVSLTVANTGPSGPSLSTRAPLQMPGCPPLVLQPLSRKALPSSCESP